MCRPVVLESGGDEADPEKQDSRSDDVHIDLRANIDGIRPVCCLEEI
jgi:hypothetical protein